MSVVGVDDTALASIYRLADHCHRHTDTPLVHIQLYFSRSYNFTGRTVGEKGVGKVIRREVQKNVSFRFAVESSFTLRTGE